MLERPKYPEITEAQWAALVALTDDRCKGLLEAIDFIQDMPDETRQFLRDAQPETVKFLRGARKEEIEKLQEGIQLVVATQLLGRVGRWTVVTLFGTFIGMMMIWDRLAAWFKASK
ncbi:hypothetical protein [Bradyrhizobium sp. 144]|uniref:hypothetical protein n=1 Tax=Bradyrhizobium sp. 144 TaxID=2782620 RepID=UPI001FF91875|nr:hypothetical protein [Bradyrhizobium sp. 144]MCK1693750.1 hypothetical protein [Bradyrhizobium sp. 144]